MGTEVDLVSMQILYKVVTVFPTPAIFNPDSPNTAYTFAAGSYEYPFEFKVDWPSLRLGCWLNARVLTVGAGPI